MPAALFFILMGLYVRDEMIHITLLNMVEENSGYSRFYILGMMFFGLYYVLQARSVRPKMMLPKVGHVFNAFIIITYFLSVFPLFDTRFALLSDYIARLLPIVALYISYHLFQTVNDKEKVLICLFVYAVFLVYYYIKTYNQRLFLSVTDVTVDSSVYSLLFLLPLLLCSKYKLLKIMALSVIGVLIIISAKRGAFIAYFLGVVVYLLVKYIRIYNLKFRSIVFVGLLLWAMVKGLDYLQTKESFFLFSRFEGIENYGYGDRGDIYPKVLRMIFSSDIIGVIIGHGYNSVIKDLGMGYSAHNDLLEIWYDFGLVGLISYLILWYNILKVGLNMMRNKSIYAAPYFLMVSIFIVNSMVSHIFLFNQYLLMFSVILGSLWGLFYRERREQLYLIE